MSQAFRSRLANTTTSCSLRTDMNDAAQECTSGENNAPALNMSPIGKFNACNHASLHHKINNLALNNRKIPDLRQEVLDRLTVQLSIRLSPVDLEQPGPSNGSAP